VNVPIAKPEDRPAMHDVMGYVEVLLDENAPMAKIPELLGRAVLEILQSYEAVMVSWRKDG
jgi:hypothetical protein